MHRYLKDASDVKLPPDWFTDTPLFWSTFAVGGRTNIEVKEICDRVNMNVDTMLATTKIHASLELMSLESACLSSDVTFSYLIRADDLHTSDKVELGLKRDLAVLPSVYANKELDHLGFIIFVRRPCGLASSYCIEYTLSYPNLSSTNVLFHKTDVCGTSVEIKQHISCWMEEMLDLLKIGKDINIIWSENPQYRV